MWKVSLITSSSDIIRENRIPRHEKIAFQFLYKIITRGKDNHSKKESLEERNKKTHYRGRR
ncbi:hypothetical protein GIB67_008270 [Kingdonia uniflora]|uniref:Uncharacterized protein n=1 Tax=Kingdonia uniflora TaxID=39325 RepID=A0A7J7N4L1_9MAGN|nr:hypothetical protein GIB67_008270 [Kingdonia uniflora]